ncbi:MAG: hypothetical protein E4H02_12690 [Lentisphaerales bacterium]|nr:MAG: hypothetical protein E4H02_12690 [Lentisphaerales bacterium]
MHMLEDLMERGYEFHVSERVQRQFGGRLRSSENWGDTSHDWAKEAEFPEAVHRRTLWTGIAAIVGLSALLFIMGYWISRRVGHRIRNVLLVVTFVLGVTYVWLARDSGWQLRLMPGVNGMMYGKWLMPIICFAAGLLTSFSKIRRSHRAVLISLLVCVSSLDFISAAALSRPVTSDRYDDWVTLQSSEATCSPAACATLLQLSGILVSEQDMVRACLTTSRGTSWQGMYRGLSLLVANDCHVGAKKYSSVDEMPLPAIINAELRSTKDEYKRYHEEWGWEPGEPHTVVVFRTEDDDGLLLADAAVGLELWDRRALDVLWNGEALVILPGRKK